eukprot:m.104743 g.104743  ORF g.104743 m.104743 type:complete len:78 (-) comp20961_c0_seq1:281-514(-)
MNLTTCSVDLHHDTVQTARLGTLPYPADSYLAPTPYTDTHTTHSTLHITHLNPAWLISYQCAPIVFTVLQRAISFEQ